MTTGVCRRCGATGRVEEHHPTCRIAGKPIHVILFVVLCIACHLAEGDICREAGLESENPSVAVLLRRLAMWLAHWVGDLPADLVASLAEVLTDVADRADEKGGS